MGAYPSTSSQMQPLRDPVDSIGNGVSLRDMMQHQQLRNLRQVQFQQTEQDQQIWQRAYRDNDGDPDKTLSQAIQKGASGESVEAFQQQQADIKDQLAQQNEEEIRKFDTQYQKLRHALQPVVNEIGRNENSPESDEPSRGGDVPRPDEDSGTNPAEGGPNPLTLCNMMQGQNLQAEDGEAEQLPGEPFEEAGREGSSGQMPAGWRPGKEQVWAQQRAVVLSDPQGYGISHLEQVPEQYPGDDFVLDQNAALAGGHKLIQQEQQLRQAGDDSTTTTQSDGKSKRRVMRPGARPEPQAATAEDMAAGNYIEAGFRRTQSPWTFHLFNHAYIGVPDITDGVPTGVMHYYEVLGNPGSIKNQQVRDTSVPEKPGVSPRHVAGKGEGVSYLRVTPAQREAMREQLVHFSQHTEQTYPNRCPSCTPRYHMLEPAPWNSNTFVYNMLIHNPAGRIEPPHPPHALLGTPGYYVNAPLEEWYPAIKP